MKRILLRSGKSPYDAISVEEALYRDVIATNSGNLIFSDAAHKILETPGTEVVSNGMPSDVSAAGRINEEYDAFVIPLANAFRPSFESALKRMTRLISKLKIPVVVLGVGAQTGVGYNPDRLKRIEPTVRDFCAAVLERSASIGVRGEFTEQYLKDMGFKDVETIGCPSLFLYGDQLQVHKKALELTPESRIAINGSHSAVRAQGLDRIITRTHERYPHLRFVGQNLSDARQLHWRDLSDPNAAVTADSRMLRTNASTTYPSPRADRLSRVGRPSLPPNAPTATTSVGMTRNSTMNAKNGTTPVSCRPRRQPARHLAEAGAGSRCWSTGAASG